jgi:hypothetical protein
MISPELRKRSRTVVDAVIVLIVMVLVIQMWLLTATLESYLAGHHGAALPGAVISGVLAAIAVSLYRFMRRLG